jgi:hypothetical protein
MSIRTRTAALAVAALAATALGAGASSASAGTLIIGNADTVTEGAAGTTVKATFPIVYQRGPLEPAFYTAQVKVEGGTATKDVDFVGKDGTSAMTSGIQCGFVPCTDVATFDVTINGDDVDEPDETVLVKLTSATTPVANPEGAKAIIRDDDEPAPAPKVDPAKPAKPGTPATPQQGTTPQQGGVTQQGTTTQQGGVTHQAPATSPNVDETGPRVGMVFRGLRDGKAKVRVSCPADELSCVGRLAVRLNGKTFASAPFRMDGGESRQLGIKLSRKQRRALNRAGVVYLRSSAFDGVGNRLVRQLSFEL